MSLIKSSLLILVISAIGFLTSCGGDDPIVPNIDEPASYAFTRDGSSTVSFSGQSTRIAMAEEIVSALKNSGLSEADLDAMFDHQEGVANFSDAALNASGKNLRSKVAASADFFSANTAGASLVKTDFETWIADQANNVFPNWSIEAVRGRAGVIQEAGGGSNRYVNRNGLECNQAVAKSLIGALMVDQALNNYLGTAVLDAGSNISNNDAGITEDGQVYTTMEHKWDEAYGYAYGASVDPADPNATIGSDDSFLNKYIGRVEGDEDFAGIADEIFNAFKLGRAAIVAKEYTIRDAQAAILRQKISEVVAIRAVYYLQQGKIGLEANNPDMASVFHDLSEGFGFVYSLQFTRDPLTTEPFFSRNEVETFINTMFPISSDRNGFWDVTPAELQSVSESIAAKFDFTVEQAGS